MEAFLEEGLTFQHPPHQKYQVAQKREVSAPMDEHSCSSVPPAPPHCIRLVGCRQPLGTVPWQKPVPPPAPLQWEGDVPSSGQGAQRPHRLAHRTPVMLAQG